MDFSLSLAQITQILLHYKYLILFPITIFEGPIITVLAGLLASLGKMNIYIAYAIIVAGDVTGDIFYYMLGRIGKEALIKRWGKFFGLTERRVIVMEEHFINHGVKTIFTAKVSHGIGTLFLVAAGIAKMPLGKFIWYNFLGTVPKSLVLILIGYYYGSAITNIRTTLDWVAVIVATIFVFFIIGYLFYRDRKNNITGP